MSKAISPVVRAIKGFTMALSTTNRVVINEHPRNLFEAGVLPLPGFVSVHAPIHARCMAGYNAFQYDTGMKMGEIKGWLERAYAEAVVVLQPVEGSHKITTHFAEFDQAYLIDPESRQFKTHGQSNDLLVFEMPMSWGGEHGFIQRFYVHDIVAQQGARGEPALVQLLVLPYDREEIKNPGPSPVETYLYYKDETTSFVVHHPTGEVTKHNGHTDELIGYVPPSSVVDHKMTNSSTKIR